MKSGLTASSGAVLGLALWLAGIPLPAEPAAPARPQVHAAYVLLAESPSGQTVAFARVILDPGAGCPELVGTGTERRATTPRPNPHGFPVKVCEALYPFGRALTVEGGPRLPAVVEHPSKIAVFGDSGCKPKDQQGCGLDDPEWPFPALARAAAARRPDLVVHVGDYNYRGTPSGFETTVDGKSVQQWYYDAGDGASPAEQCGIPGPYWSQNSPGNPDADAWPAWWSDFFEPARDLLLAAPWVFVRGNHELCSHAGPGWFYFLDPSSELPEGGGRQLSCPPQGGGGPALPHLRFVEPQVLHLGALDLLVLDSANACDELPGFTEVYRDQATAAAKRLRSRAWLLTHRPVWGIDGAGATSYDCDGQPEPGSAQPYDSLNRTLQCALRGETGQSLLPALDQILAGHMHRFEALSFAAPASRPPTLVVGNSGVAEDSGPPTGAFAQELDGTPAVGFSVVAFGYLELARSPAGTWRGSVVALDPAVWSPFLSPCPTPGESTPGLCVAPARTGKTAGREALPQGD
jgi:hypothetical protein